MDSGVAIGPGEARQLIRVASLQFEAFPPALITHTQLAHVTKLVAQVDATPGDVSSIGREELIVLVDIERIAIDLSPGCDEPVAGWGEGMVILRPQPILGE